MYTIKTKCSFAKPDISVLFVFLKLVFIIIFHCASQGISVKPALGCFDNTCLFLLLS